MEISLCMIVKDEEEVLARCLECASQFVDEIVLVDTGSTDRTKEIGESFNAKIYDFTWCEDFAKARNEAFSHGTKEYILWLDADDYITKDNIEKMIQLKNTLDPSIDVVSMHYSLGRDAEGNTISSLRRNRLVKRDKGFKWIGKVHEYLEVYGASYPAEVSIHHDKHKTYTDRNLRIFRKMQEDQIEFSARDVYYYANELYYNGFYEEAIEQYKRFLPMDGWVEDKKLATANLIQCYNATQQPEEKLNAILESFKWTRPRADICCRLAEVFFDREDYENAIFWYKVALMCAPSKGNLSLDHKEYYTWIPAIQLCVCFSRIGDFYMSHYYNELCGQLGGDKGKVEYNRQYLKGEFEARGMEVPTLDACLVDARFK